MDQTPTKRDRMRERIVNGHIGQTVWWLSWPSVFAMLLQSANGLFDAAFVGRISAPALSGVGLASQIMIILMSISTAISIGATAIIARYVGANDHKTAEKAIRQSILLAIVMSVVSGVVTYAVGPFLIRAMGGSGEDLRLGTTYLNILLLGITPYFFMIVLTGVFRGVGDVRTPLLVMGVVTAVGLVGDYLLIFGVGPFPRLGVVGAGIATVISRIVAMVLLLAFIPRTHFGNALRGPWRADWGWFKRILNIGYPAGVQGVLRTTALMAFFGILRRTPESLFGTAALTIGLRIESLAFMPGFAFSIAATSMVGQNLGARQIDRAEKSAWAANWQAIGVTSVMGLMFILFSYPIARLFTNDPEVLPLAARYLQINGISEPFLAMAMVLTGALQGAGETRLPTWATIITQWIVRLPLTYILAVTLDMGALGAWISMSITTVLGGLVTLAIFKSSCWQETQI